MGIALSDFSTIQIGGPAKSFLSIEKSDNITSALDWAKQNNLPTFILGGGSNTLFSDAGFAGLILHNNLKGIEWTDTGKTMQALVASGESWDEFVEACIEKGLSGVEAMSGIPGQVGSTPIQNVGAYGQEVRSSIAYVEALNLKTGETETFQNKDCGFAYRSSRFKTKDKGRYFITAVCFELPKSEEPKILYQELFHYVKQNLRYKNLGSIPERLTAIRTAVLSIRTKKSMVIRKKDKNSQSLGSFFINPVMETTELEALLSKLSPEQKQSFRTHKSAGKYKLSAAWLIEQAGFQKGHKHKSVKLSDNHCLAICNPGNATSEDVKDLALCIQTKVKELWSVDLYPEPGFV